MKRHLVALVVLILSLDPVFAQQPPRVGPEPAPTDISLDTTMPTFDALVLPAAESSGFSAAIVPFLDSSAGSAILSGRSTRALTQIWPVFGSTWTDPIGPLPGGNVQLYGPGLKHCSDRAARIWH